MSRVGRLLLWTKAPRSLRHFNALCRTPVQAQDQLLRQILETNADTEFGRRHGFAGITTLKQFQERVPIASYEDLEPYINAEMNGRPKQLTKDPPVLFTTTSGTTGARKYIPMTREGKNAKSHLTWLWLCGLYRDHPGIVGGRILSVVSPEVESHAPSGVPCGAESGHAYRTMPGPVRSMYTAPTGCSPSRTTRPSTTRCCAGRRPGTSASSPRSTRAPSSCWSTGWPAHRVHHPRRPRRVAVGRRRRAPELRASLRLRPDPSAPGGWSGRLPASTASCGPGWRWPKLAVAGCWKEGRRRLPGEVRRVLRRDHRSGTSLLRHRAARIGAAAATRATPV